MAKGKTSLIQQLEVAKKNKVSRNPPRIDVWLKTYPQHRKELVGAILWLGENRTNDFSWTSLADELHKKWPDFPEGKQHLIAWARRNHPGLGI